MSASEANTNPDKSSRNEWKVVLALVLSVLLMEALVRSFAGSLSLDVRNTLELPETAIRISHASEEVRTVLVVGNSLARCGLDLELFRKDPEWVKDGQIRGMELELFAPDASCVVQWDWGMKRYFANAGSHPDVILLFTGRNHLLDLPTSSVILGSYYVGTPDLGEALKSMQGSEDRISLLLGATSNLLANRNRIGPRICYSYLPGYETAWPTLTTGNDAKAENSHLQTQVYSTKSFERFIATVQEMGSDLHVISVPMPEPYTLPEPTLRLMEKAGVTHHDLSSLPGIDAARFPDGYHLDKTGARTFTQALLRALRP